MRSHHPMQTDTPLQMMNSAVPATIQSAVEKRRNSSVKGGLVTFTFALVCSISSYRRLPVEEAPWVTSRLATAEVGSCQVQVMRLAPEGSPAQARRVALAA